MFVNVCVRDRVCLCVCVCVCMYVCTEGGAMNFEYYNAKFENVQSSYILGVIECDSRYHRHIHNLQNANL